MIQSYEDLEVYQRTYKMALDIHQLTLKFPGYERFELGSQLRRATKSIPINIAEGYGKRNSTEGLSPRGTIIEPRDTGTEKEEKQKSTVS